MTITKRKSPRPLLQSFDTSGGPSACWRWTGSMARYGYGRWVRDGRSEGAHRAVYRALVGPIPSGLDLDHACHNADPSCMGGITCTHRACVNPLHLKPKPRKANVLAGKTVAAVNAAKTLCIHGHPFDEANTYITSQGWRGCRVCNAERKRRSRARKARATHAGDLT